MASAPMKTLDEAGLARGARRWRFVPLRERLDGASARPAARAPRPLERAAPHDIGFSHFARAAAANRELNLTATFTAYLAAVEPVSLSLPLVFRNRRRVVDSTLRALLVSAQEGAEATPALADCLAALSRDLGAQEFAPFFARVVAAFAEAFDERAASTRADASTPSAVADANVGTQLWDPERALVPVFSALSQITKTVMPVLVADPDAAFRDLEPLLAHAHYRIREMTAEACAGYILRKTRDETALKALTVALVRCADGERDGVCSETSAAVDGVGVALFEAMRLPSGGVHSRALDVLIFGLRSVREDCSDAHLDASSPRLAAVSRAMARLSRHAHQSTDIQGIASVLVNHADSVADQQNALAVGDACFLIRMWLRSARQTASSHLGDVFTQRISNMLIRVMQTFHQDVRAVYEAFGALLTIVEQLPRHRVRRTCVAFNSAIVKACESASTSSLEAMLDVLFKSLEKYGCSLRPQDVSQGVAAMCNHLAVLTIDSKQGSSDMRALGAVVRFMRMGGSAGTANFKVPAVQEQVACVVRAAGDAQVSQVAPASHYQLHMALEVARHLPMAADLGPALQQLAVRSTSVTVTLALVVEAIACQGNARDLVDGTNKAAALAVDRILSGLVAAPLSLPALRSLNRYLVTYPAERLKLIRSASESSLLTDIVGSVARNLSFGCPHVRKESAMLLATMSTYQALLVGDNEKDVQEVPAFSVNDVDDEDALAAVYEDLRDFKAGVPNAVMFRAVAHVFAAPRTLDRIATTSRILFEVTKAVIRHGRISAQLQTALVSACVGLFRTRFKPAWAGARELWCAVAAIDSDVAMSPLLAALQETRDMLLLPTDAAEMEDSGEGLHDDDAIDDEAGDAGEDPDKPNSQGARVVAGEGLERTKSLRRQSRKRPRSAPVTNDEAEAGTGVNENAAASQGAPALRVTRNISKKQRTQERLTAALVWRIGEWRVCVDGSMLVSDQKRDDFPGTAPSKEQDTDCTDAVTLHQELLGALEKQPKHTLKYRSLIVNELYLKLSPSRFSRRTGDAIAKSYAVLLEKMGGLKVTETNRELELSMRNRLLSDLCRPGCVLQAAVVRCLCVSRSPGLKPHKESLVRLVDDGSFREELVLITEHLAALPPSDSNQTPSKDQCSLPEVLVRICFSKMRGRRARIDARRSAVLSFIVSTLSWETAIPQLVNLALEPLASLLDVDIGTSAELPQALSTSSKGEMPPCNVQRGILHSVEAILKQCRGAVLGRTWRRVALAMFVLLRGAGQAANAQDVRSRALKQLASMMVRQPAETAFICEPVMLAVRSAQFDVTGVDAVVDPPAFLYFLSSAFRSESLRETQRDVLVKHKWACQWALDILGAKNAGPPAIELALEVASGLVSVMAKAEAVGSLQPDAYPVDFTAAIASALHGRLSRMIDIIDAEWSKHKMWKNALESTMSLIERLSMCGSLKEEVAWTLADAMSDFVVESRFYTDASVCALRAFGALIRRVFLGSKTDPDHSGQGVVAAADRYGSKLSPLFAQPLFVQRRGARDTLCDALASFPAADIAAAVAITRKLGAMQSSRINDADIEIRLAGLQTLIDALKRAAEGLPSEDSEDCENGSLYLDATDTVIELVAEKPRARCGALAVSILSHGCILAVVDEDSSVRGTASYALALLCKWVGSSKAHAAVCSRRGMLALLVDAVVSCNELAERREYSRCLGEFVRSCDSTVATDAMPLLTALQSLARPDDLDADFFENVAHMQPHRRGRALRRLANKISDTSLDVDFASAEDTTVDGMSILAARFAYPLGKRIALDISETKSSGQQRGSLQVIQSKDATRKDVSYWAVSLSGTAARLLSWQEYRAALASILRELPRETNELVLFNLYNLLVAVAESYPSFSPTAADQVASAAARKHLTNQVLPKMLAHVTHGAVEGDILSAVIDSHKSGQQGRTQTRAPPTLFRAPVAIAIGRLMARLPEEELDSKIPLLVTPLAGALRSRMSDTRDGAKKALVSVVLMLNPKYMPYVVRQIIAALAQGHRKDACVYVIHALLLGIQDFVNTEAADGATRNMFPIDDAATVLADSLAEELESGVHANNKDFEDPNATGSRQRDAATRATRVSQCTALLAELVQFEVSAATILSPFEERLVKTSSSKLATRLENALQHMVMGFTRNKSLTPAEALKFSFRLVHANMPPAADSTSTRQLDDRVEERVFNSAPNVYKIVTLGLQIVSSVLGKSIAQVDGKSAEAREIRAMLEPFLPELVFAMQSRHDSLTLAALRSAQRLMRVPLRNRKEVADAMTDVMVNVLSRNVGVFSNPGARKSANLSCDELFHACLRAASVLVQEVGKSGDQTVKTERVRVLLGISRNCLDRGTVEARSAALALIRSTVTAKLVLPEVYDAVEQVNKLVIRAQSSSLRSTCSSISVLFLISFPLGATRVRQHLEFFVRNLNYEHRHGRLAAVQTLTTVICKFPNKHLLAESNYLFMSLAAIVARDEDSVCREAASVALKELFAHVDNGRKVAELLRMALMLIGFEERAEDPGAADSGGFHLSSYQDALVQRSGAGALAAAAQSGVLSPKQLSMVVHASALVLANLRNHTDDPPVSWEVEYAILICMEHCLKSQPEGQSIRDVLEVQDLLKPLWDAVPDLLVHSHAWVRLVAARLLGRHLSAVGGREASLTCPVGESRLYSVVWTRNGVLRALLRALCLQFEASHLSEALAQQSLKNVLCLASVIRQCADAGAPAIGSEARDAMDGNNDEEEDEAPPRDNRPMWWLMARVSGMAGRVGKDAASNLRRACALRFLAAGATWWGTDFMRTYLPLFIPPIVQILQSADVDKAIIQNEATMTSDTSDDDDTRHIQKSHSSAPDNAIGLETLKLLAHAVQNTLVSGVGADEYYKMYNEESTKRTGVKEARKRKAAFERAINPERAAKRRRKKAESRKARKHRNGTFGYKTKVTKASFAVFEKQENPLTEDM